MAAATKLPKGTILRYKAVGDQPQRTMLVLADGQLRCLRVGERTWKNHQLPTYPSLEAFLDIVPADPQEEFKVEFGADYARKSGNTWMYHFKNICHILRDDDYNKAEQYLLTLGNAGESPEGGYVFYREVLPALCCDDEPVGSKVWPPAGSYFCYEGDLVGNGVQKALRFAGDLYICYEDDAVGSEVQKALDSFFFEPPLAQPKVKRIKISPPPWERRKQPPRACKAK